jgi:hypothetical protein
VIPAFPKPSQVRKKKEPVKVLAGGREVCTDTPDGKAEYRRRKTVMWERQGRKCGLMIAPQCKLRQGRLPKDEVTFEHIHGRGGGKRDDRIEIDGKPYNLAACPWCNALKASRPLSAFMKEVVP